ncbi:MAG TPA: hypothetical protein DCP22_02385 [Ruminococcaceae bacterium]|nr:hypothetical protein [Oscillospiraceae bacterium]
MKSYSALPPGYAAYATLDLLNNKKQFYIVNGISIGLAVLLVILPFLWGWSPESSDGFGLFFLRFLVFILGTLAYISLHELTHGLVMKACGARVHYGFKVAYAYAGSYAYFSRLAYFVIALAPVVIWGIVFALLLPRLPSAWRWTAWLWQLINISGAAGDFYCAFRIVQAPAGTLVQDTGTDMTFYSPQQ